MVFRGSVEDESNVNVLIFGLWCAIKVPFVEGCLINECSSVVPG